MIKKRRLPYGARPFAPSSRMNRTLLTLSIFPRKEAFFLMNYESWRDRFLALRSFPHISVSERKLLKEEDSFFPHDPPAKGQVPSQDSSSLSRG